MPETLPPAVSADRIFIEYKRLLKQREADLAYIAALEQQCSIAAALIKELKKPHANGNDKL